MRLARSKAKWKIVIGHHPIKSQLQVGTHQAHPSTIWPEGCSILLCLPVGCDLLPPSRSAARVTDTGTKDPPAQAAAKGLAQTCHRVASAC